VDETIGMDRVCLELPTALRVVLHRDHARAHDGFE
jgi:hypothetical protein